MKKTLLFVFGACMFIATAKAQDTQAFKQAGGENNLQLQFTPWGSTPIDLNENGTIMYRKFFAGGKSAFRIGFSVGSGKSSNVLVMAADTGDSAPGSSFPLEEDLGFGSYTLRYGVNPQADESNKSFSFSIRPGYEMHMAGTERLSPYWGAELVFTKSSFKRETDQVGHANYTAVYYDTTTVNPIVQAPYTIYTLNYKESSTTFGINVIAGFDFYFAKNLSLGAEWNFGYATTSYSDIENERLNTTVTSTDNLNPLTLVTTTTVTSTNVIVSKPDIKKASSSGFGPGVVAQLKLGWLF
jgi:opacity protein-like surface antigen